MSLKFYVREGNVKISNIFSRTAPEIRLKLSGYKQPAEQIDADVTMYERLWWVATFRTNCPRSNAEVSHAIYMNSRSEEW
jgi:hypothetical protein